MRYLYEPLPDTTLNAFISLGLMSYLPHISREQFGQIAYTASLDDALRDKVTRSTLGRFMRRFCPILTDKYIQKIEQDFASFIDPNFNIAVTASDIEYVYTHMEGDTGCMRHDKSHWSGLHVHPSAVYAAPGMGVAYLGEIGGRVTARTVIWTNPNDQADKRYVRIYGAPHLKSKLERAGYRCTGLDGAEIAAIPVRGENNCVVMPYMDAPAGDQGRTDKAVCAVRTAERPGYLRLLSNEAANALHRRGIKIAQCNATGGRVSVTPQHNVFGFTCKVAGRYYEHDSGETCVTLVTPDGTFTAAKSAVENNDAYVMVYDPSNPGTMAFAQKVNDTVDMVQVIENNEARTTVEPLLARAKETKNYLPLCAKYYGQKVYAHGGGVVVLSYQSGADRFALRNDVVGVAEPSGSGVAVMHKTEVILPSGRTKKAYMFINTRNDIKQFAFADDSRIKPLYGGGRTHPSLEPSGNLVELYDGQLARKRSAKPVRLFRSWIYLPTDGVFKADSLSDGVLSFALEDAYIRDSFALDEADQHSYIRRLFYGQFPMLSGRTLCVQPAGSDASWGTVDLSTRDTSFHEQKKAAEFILAHQDEAERIFIESAKLFKRVCDELERRCPGILAAVFPPPSQAPQPAAVETPAAINSQLDALLAEISEVLEPA